MKTLTRLALSVSLMGLSCSLPITAMAAVDAQTPAKVSIEAKHKASFLFVLRADTGVITKSDGVYTLTLKGLDEQVLYFSDRPVRVAGFITVSQFMSDWAAGNNSFKANPPNAAIVHAALKTNAKEIAQALPVELTHPAVTIEGLSFQLKDLQGKMSLGRYSRVVLFVDSLDDSFTWGFDGGGDSDYPMFSKHRR